MQRTKSLEAFKTGEVPLLVATDVAARGLDIPEVKVVLNYTFPLTAEDYVHRIGRTGRAGNKGLAHTLFTEHDKGLAGALVNVLKAAKQPVPAELMKFLPSWLSGGPCQSLDPLEIDVTLPRLFGRPLCG